MDTKSKKSVQPFGIQLLASQEVVRIKAGVKAGVNVHSLDIRESPSTAAVRIYT
jgi:hypothetical protein